ncbi:ABC transporter substrate-binding protein [Caenimonas koreensis DSM 17982]|uniref:ABC transporter substrate-binding protein n=1 Tax=Caenimonas koreensis DSM 17982 TaxID=1121255 RepID=A0A844B6Z4_9BURK|nr:ABC transporter substrate-binding protein [Caenimonas koreensis DSM 17982]
MTDVSYSLPLWGRAGVGASSAGNALVAAVLFTLLLLATFTASATTTVTDDRGVAITLTQPPQRIVTLLPSLTETVCELGACQRLVGVDSFSNWPDGVRRLPHVGGVDDASIETIVSLQPDLVLLSSTSRALTRLESLRVPVFGVDLKTMADVHRALGKVGQLLGVSPAAAATISARVDRGIGDAARGVPASAQGATVYFEVATGPYAASASSHIGELLARLGARNIVAGELGSVPKINPELVVRADPQVIIISQRDAASLASRPGWSRLRAIREGRVCALTQQQGDVIARPGPRLDEAARSLALCLVSTKGGAR